MLFAKQVVEASKHIPRLRQGHKGTHHYVACPRGCNQVFNRRSESEKDFEKMMKAYNGRHFLSGDKRIEMVETLLITGHWPEAKRKEEDVEIGGEVRTSREQAMIRGFNSGDIVQIVIPFLAQKHGALKDGENSGLHGSIHRVLPTPLNASRYERLVTIKKGDKTVGIPATWCRLVEARA